MAAFQALYDLYVTPLKDELAYADGAEKYHGVHAQYHPIYRKKLYDRGYYDIFFFDLNGDLIYSVFKVRALREEFSVFPSFVFKRPGI